MKDNFRILILDYPKVHLNQQGVQRSLSDLIISKQLNFARASESYVSMGPLDMVSTHILIYDQVDIYNPKVIAAVRCCYQNRTSHHNLKLPIEDYIQYTPNSYQEKFRAFRAGRSNLADVNAWFVDPDYTFSRTNLRLSELIYFSFIMYLVRKGFDSWVGTTNEKFKASRWAMPTGYAEDGLIYTHPLVDSPHKLLLFESLNYDWLQQCANTYDRLVVNQIEILPPAEHLPHKEICLSVSDAYAIIEERRTQKLKLVA